MRMINSNNKNKNNFYLNIDNYIKKMFNMIVIKLLKLFIIKIFFI